MYPKILVPVDGSAPAKLALEEAIKLAQALKASIRLLHVVEAGSLLKSEAAAAGYDTLFDMLCRDGALLLQDAAATISHAGIIGDIVLVEAPEAQVGECIVRKAREYQTDLIICGTHGRRGVRYSPVPVLLVRMPHALNQEPSAKGGAAA